MSDFGLDLESVERMIDEDELQDDGRVVLGVLDGSTDPDEWVELVLSGNILVLAIEGELEALAETFAEDIDDAGGQLVHFRSFLIVTPPDVPVDNDRLS